jgi:hypothetical protein
MWSSPLFEDLIFLIFSLSSLSRSSLTAFSSYGQVSNRHLKFARDCHIPAWHLTPPGRHGKIAVCLQRLNHQPICSVEKSVKMQKKPSGPWIRPSGCHGRGSAARPVGLRETDDGENGADHHTNWPG